jgi:hypothetical protein
MINILQALNEGKKLRRKSWLELENKNSEVLYIKVIEYFNRKTIFIFTNNKNHDCFKGWNKIAKDGNFWGVDFVAANRELLEDDWEIIDNLF